MRALLYSTILILTAGAFTHTTSANSFVEPKPIIIATPKITMQLQQGKKASIVSLIVNGQKVVSNPDGIFTSVKIKGVTYSSLNLKGDITVSQRKETTSVSGIRYGDANLTITEKWIFTTSNNNIDWEIERTFSNPVEVEELSTPVIQFDNTDTWEAAYQGYGGVAWFYLFNEKLCTYGVHTNTSSFWNSKTGNGLNVNVRAAGKAVAMKYTRTADDRLAYTITVAKGKMIPLHDSGTNRRRFVRKSTSIWSPFGADPGKTTHTVSFSYFDYKDKYDRGTLVGVNGDQVNAVLNTIARIGVIDSLHVGGNSWHTPYGPICLHEQYIGEMGLGINDPDYLKGYKGSLDFYRDNAIKPDGRVFSRWAYTNEDAIPGQYNDAGFYEAQWGILMDSNADLITNIADVYDQTGDTKWVKGHQASCEKVLDWILKRDTDGDGLVEMMTDGTAENKGSDWIDIIWAAYENAFINAKLYYALVKWAEIERVLGDNDQAVRYESSATKLKASFNKPTGEGGLWDVEKQCYVHWRDKDNSIHGRNMVTPVNFMAIAYGLCDDNDRKKVILDAIEKQMLDEKLFFWPLCMTSYAPGEGKDWQFPFPSYENGDLFLSWGSVGVKAYASYNPEIAVKYVRNVLNQYGKDGLAFQRYGRVKQDGQGDDILSGNSLAIVGLYQSIYGINPKYNRFYLEPHLTPELEGTVLKYYYHGKRLTVRLDKNKYSVTYGNFTLTSPDRFGYNADGNNLCYFHNDEKTESLKLTTESEAAITIKGWRENILEWEQEISKPIPGKKNTYQINHLTPNQEHIVSVNGNVIEKKRSDDKGQLIITRNTAAKKETITISRGN